jgi:hypothetical protein
MLRPSLPRCKNCEAFFNPGFGLLPAVAAITTVAAATVTAASATTAASIAATTTAATSTASSSSTAAPTTTSTTAVASATSTATAAAFGLGLGLIHHQVAPAKILPVQPSDGLLGLFIGGHFHEGEPARLSREAVPDERNG